MKVTFVSNYYNHHQSSLSENLWKETLGNYAFVATSDMREERKGLGYLDKDQYGYVIKAHNSDFEKRKAQSMIDTSDAVIFGSAPEDMIKSGIKSGQLIFRYCERPMKSGFEPLKYFPRFVKWHRQNPANKPIYLLCAGAYTSSDYAKFGLFRNRAYKWGYFPETKHYASFSSLMSAKNRNEILWCGRFLDWKHPDDVISAVNRLKNEGYDFKLSFIGTGPMENKLRAMVAEYGLSDRISFTGPQPPEKVREYMERSAIYVFTSDRREGWGAVLNESMNSGCAVVACDAIGSVPFLLKNKENGLIYRSRDVDMLYDSIRYLLDNPQEQERMGKTAYETIINEWNAETAATRFLKLCEAILNGEQYPDLYKSGPCSKAEIINESWFER